MRNLGGHVDTSRDSPKRRRSQQAKLKCYERRQIVYVGLQRGEGQGEGQPGSTPHTSVLASDCQGAPDSEDSENDRHHNEFRVFRLLAQLPVEPPNQSMMNIQQPKRADKSEDSENWRPRSHFRVFRFPAWLAEEPENKQS